MLRRQRAELAIHHERWLVSYADFMTLLFGFFVVMYAVSNMHEQKYQELSETLTELFAVPEDTSDSASTLPKDINHSQHQDIVSRETIDGKPSNSMASISELVEQLEEKFADLLGDQSITISSDEHWLQLSLNNTLLFALGSVEPSQQAHIIIEEVASVLKNINNPIQVEGFTDNLAINTERFPSNWELSSIRAVAILKLLIANGVTPQNLSAVGYGEFQAIADNSTSFGRAQNRRVVIKVGQQATSPNSINNKIENSELGSNNPPSIDQPVNTQKNNDPLIKTEEEGITPITLDNGELLFTNDPDLPRNAR